MSESAGKMRHGAEKTAKAVGATAAGAAEGRRVQSIREPLSPAPTWSTRWTISLVWWNAPGPSSQERPASRWPRAWPPRLCW